MSARVHAVTILVMLAVMGLVGHSVTTGMNVEQVEDAQSWCDDRDGDLWMENAFVHGGLHCEVPNGTVYHVREMNLPSNDTAT